MYCCVYNTYNRAPQVDLERAASGIRDDVKLPRTSVQTREKSDGTTRTQDTSTRHSKIINHQKRKSTSIAQSTTTATDQTSITFSDHKNFLLPQNSILS